MTKGAAALSTPQKLSDGLERLKLGEGEDVAPDDPEGSEDKKDSSPNALGRLDACARAGLSGKGRGRRPGRYWAFLLIWDP